MKTAVLLLAGVAVGALTAYFALDCTRCRETTNVWRAEFEGRTFMTAFHRR